MTLEDRVAKLEAKLNPPTSERMNIFVSGFAPNEADQEFRRLKHGERFWDRQDGESEDDFKARAIHDVGTDRPVTLFFAT